MTSTGTQQSPWVALAQPIPADKLSWRIDGKPRMRDGKFYARHVVYIEAGTVRERLDQVVPGEWDLHLELLPVMPEASETPHGTPCAFKARLTILDVVREDVGVGSDYKQAATDAFKRVAVRFGIGHELYEYEQNWVPMDGDGKFAKPTVDPQENYNRRHASNGAQQAPVASAPKAAPKATPAPAAASNTDDPPCPKCGGKCWDNRIGKKNPRAPDFRCRDKSCDGVIWPPKPGAVAQLVGADADDGQPRDEDRLPF